MPPQKERPVTARELEDVRKTISNTKVYQFVGWRFLAAHIAAYIKNKTPRTAGWLAYELDITHRRAMADLEYIIDVKQEIAENIDKPLPPMKIEALTETFCRLAGVDASYSQQPGAKKGWSQLQALLQQETQFVHSLWRLQAIRGNLEAASVQVDKVVELNKGVMTHITELLNRVGPREETQIYVKEKAKELRSA